MKTDSKRRNEAGGLGTRTLLVNPPPIKGIRYTRQGRCQEPEHALGTIKPPLSLALLAALLRDRGFAVHLSDLTASRQQIDALIATLDAIGFSPTLIVFPSTFPTLEADVAAMAQLKARYRSLLICFGPHATLQPAEAMLRAPHVDGMCVGEPEDTLLTLASCESLDAVGSIEGLTWRRGSQVFPHRARGTFAGFAQSPRPAWELLDLALYRLPIVEQPYVLVETSRGCPYTCDFCVAPFYQGHRLRERPAEAVVDEIETLERRFGITHVYLWADTTTLNGRTLEAICDGILRRQLKVRWISNARADNLLDTAFVDKLRRAGCWMLAFGIESGSMGTRDQMKKGLQDSAIYGAITNLRRVGIRSLGFFMLGYPGENAADLDATIDFALAVNPDYANFYPVVPYPGTALHHYAAAQGLLTAHDWARLEYDCYVMRSPDLDEATVMSAVQRGTRRFYLRPSFLSHHAADIVRLAVNRWPFAWSVVSRAFRSQVACRQSSGRSGAARSPAQE